MTTSALELRNNLAIDILTMEDDSMVLKVSKYIAKLKNKLTTRKDDTITKEEILAGIDAGLKEMKLGLGTPAEDFLKELQ